MARRPAGDAAGINKPLVAAVVRPDGISAVLKLAMPHMEGASEIDGLRFWNGDPTVQILEADNELGAMLLERCQPGHSLRSEPELKQDILIASLLSRLWKLCEVDAERLRLRTYSDVYYTS